MHLITKTLEKLRIPRKRTFIIVLFVFALFNWRPRKIMSTYVSVSNHMQSSLQDAIQNGLKKFQYTTIHSIFPYETFMPNFIKRFWFIQIYSSDFKGHCVFKNFVHFIYNSIDREFLKVGRASDKLIDDHAIIGAPSTLLKVLMQAVLFFRILPKF